MSLPIVITDVGMAELLASQVTTQVLSLDAVLLGSASYVPTSAATSLVAQFKVIDGAQLSGSVLSDQSVIHITITDASNEVYSINEIGVRSASGALFAVYSQIGDPIFVKTANTTLMLAFDIIIKTGSLDNVVIDSPTFGYPQATLSQLGIAKLATQVDVDNNDNQTIVTPDILNAAVAAKKSISMPHIMFLRG